MNYRKDMENIINYIEDNIKRKISTDELAAFIGYSPFHFSRIFYAYRGMNVKEYVRYRRLSLAARAIFDGQKITDAAFEYGFETLSGFSKAFKRQFGCSPTAYQGQIIHIIDQLPIFSKEELHKLIRLEEISSFFVAGYPIGVPSTKDEAALWLDADADGEEDQLELIMYEELNPSKHGEFGMYNPEASSPQYILAVRLEDEKRLRPFMKKVEIKSGLYAVFTTPPAHLTGNANEKFATIIRTVWKSIFVNFFDDASLFEYDLERVDFEYYDERCHSDIDAYMEIWIPVKERKL